MKKLSSVILADLVASKRKEKSMTQQALAEATGINRALISRIEKQDFIPSIPQLEQLGEVLGFEQDSVFADTAHDRLPSPSPLRIAVAGTGYVGLSIATLLAAQPCDGGRHSSGKSRSHQPAQIPDSGRLY